MHLSENEAVFGAAYCDANKDVEGEEKRGTIRGVRGVIWAVPTLPEAAGVGF
jgi:hypothetical protein